MTDHKNNPANKWGFISEVFFSLPKKLRIFIVIMSFALTLAFISYKFDFIRENLLGAGDINKSQGLYYIRGKLVSEEDSMDLYNIRKVCLAEDVLECDDMISEGIFQLGLETLPPSKMLSLRIYISEYSPILKEKKITRAAIGTDRVINLGIIPISTSGHLKKMNNNEKNIGISANNVEVSTSNLLCHERGIITDKNHSPIEGATVILLMDANSLETKTKGDGSYSLEIVGDFNKEIQYRIEAIKGELRGSIIKSLCDNNYLPIIIE